MTGHVSSPAPSQPRMQILIDSIDKGPIMLTDYFHRDYFSIVEDVVGKDITKVVSATRAFSPQKSNSSTPDITHILCHEEFADRT